MPLRCAVVESTRVVAKFFGILIEQASCFFLFSALSRRFDSLSSAPASDVAHLPRFSRRFRQPIDGRRESAEQPDPRQQALLGRAGLEGPHSLLASFPWLPFFVGLEKLVRVSGATRLLVFLRHRVSWNRETVSKLPHSLYVFQPLRNLNANWC